MRCILTRTIACVWYNPSGKAFHSRNSLLDELLFPGASKQLCDNILLQLLMAFKLLEYRTKR